MSKKIQILSVKIILCGVLLAWLFSKMDFKEFSIILASVDFRFLIASYALLFVNTSLSALKWKILLKSDGVDIPFKFLLQSYLVGTFANLFLPSSIGGDVVRIYDVAKAGNSTSKSFASVFMDRASGFFALSAIGFLASVSGYGFISENKIITGLMLIFLLIVVTFICLFNSRIHSLILKILKIVRISKLSGFFEKFTGSLNTYRQRKGIFAKILSISFLFQAMVVFIVYLYSRGLGYDTGYIYFLIFIPIITVIESVPLTPYALGIRDASYVFFFTKAGLGIEQAEMLAITYLVMTFLYALLGGIVFVSRKDYSRPVH